MKFFRKLIVMIAALAFLIALCGCNEVKEAESALSSAAAALQEGDSAKAANYINNSEIVENEMFNNSENGQELMKALFGKLSCTVNSAEKVDSSTVKINADITAINTSEAFSNTVSQIFTLALTGGVSEEEMDSKMIEIFIENLNSEDAETVTNNVDINMIKTDEGWKVDADETLQDAITGGLVSSLGNISNTLGQ